MEEGIESQVSSAVCKYAQLVARASLERETATVQHVRLANLPCCDGLLALAASWCADPCGA